MFVFASVFAVIIFDGEHLETHVEVGLDLHLASAFIGGFITTYFSGCNLSIAGPDINPTVFFAAGTAVIKSHIVGSGEEKEKSQMVTVLLLIVTGSLAVSLSFYTLGKLRLSRLIQFTPASVLSGFLACVGFAVVAEAITVSTGVHFSGSHLDDIFLTWNGWKLLLPALFLGVPLYVAKRYHFSEPAIYLPIFLILPFIIFYISLLSTGTSHEEAEASGWFFPEARTATFYDPWVWFWGNISYIDGDAYLAALPDVLAMVVIVTLDYLFKLAGTEKALAIDLDYDDEMRLTGKFNLINALFVGPPSYSQMKFNVMNHGIVGRTDDRLPGYIAATFTMFMYFGGFPLINILPRFFLGGLLFFAGLGFLVENLWDARQYLSKKEWVTVWIILILFLVFGLLIAVIAGIGLAAIIFSIQYSTRTEAKAIVTGKTFHSTVVRPLVHYQKLQHLGDLMLGIVLKGLVFFGSVSKIQNYVSDHIRQQEGEKKPRYARTRYVIFDFESVLGMDSSSPAVFMKLTRMASHHQYVIVWSGLSSKILSRLEGEGVIGERDLVFESMDLATEFVEENILKYAATIRSKWLILPFMKKLNAVASYNATRPPFEDLFTSHGGVLWRYCQRETLSAGTVLFRTGELLPKLFILQSGKCGRLEMGERDWKREERMGGREKDEEREGEGERTRERETRQTYRYNERE